MVLPSKLSFAPFCLMFSPFPLHSNFTFQWGNKIGTSVNRKLRLFILSAYLSSFNFRYLHTEGAPFNLTADANTEEGSGSFLRFYFSFGTQSPSKTLGERRKPIARQGPSHGARGSSPTVYTDKASQPPPSAPWSPLLWSLLLDA